MFANITLVKIRRANYWPLSSLPYSLIFLKRFYYVKNKTCNKFLCFLPYMWIAFNQMPGVLMSFAKSFRSPIPFLYTFMNGIWKTKNICTQRLNTYYRKNVNKYQNWMKIQNDAANILQKLLGYGTKMSFEMIMVDDVLLFLSIK